MASLSGSAEELHRRMLANASAPTWERPEDLSRMSFEALARTSEFGRHLLSEGAIRLAGAGVVGSSAPMDDVAKVMSQLQKLVAASGAALSNIQSARGKLPTEILKRTLLRLTASPIAGSIVLTFAPASNPVAELTPGGEVPMFDVPEDQLADLAVAEVLQMMNSFREVGEGADLDFPTAVSGRGPRFASALRDFAGALGAAQFDTEVAWRQPGRPTIRTALTSTEALELSSQIVSRHLDIEDVEVVGILRTISDVSKILVETAEGDKVQFAGHRLTREEIESATVHSTVRIRGELTPEVQPGGVEVERYVATSMEVIKADDE